MTNEEMTQTIAHVSLVVREYDEAIAFFTQVLSFALVEDTTAIDREGNYKRWVLVRPPGSRGTDLLLARASTPEEESRIGNQAGICCLKRRRNYRSILTTPWDSPLPTMFTASWFDCLGLNKV